MSVTIQDYREHCSCESCPLPPVNGRGREDPYTGQGGGEGDGEEHR